MLEFPYLSLFCMPHKEQIFRGKFFLLILQNFNQITYFTIKYTLVSYWLSLMDGLALFHLLWNLMAVFS